MTRIHLYQVNLEWTGNCGIGTTSYTAYSRDHEIGVEGKPLLHASSDPLFRGNKVYYNPEELLVASLSSCHMLWYLHLCAESGVVVKDYTDQATGIMQEMGDIGGYFTEVTLSPVVTVSQLEMANLAQSLHSRANQLCFIANSCKFPVYHRPTCLVEGA